jgi:hypothetical protein
MAESGDTGGAGRLDIGALSVGATALVSVLGGLSLTGTVGRVLRNDAGPITIALVLVLFGAALLVAAGLPATGHLLTVIFSLVGLELTLAGLVITGVVGVGTAGEGERPAISGQVTDAGRRLTGKVVAGNLKSDAKFAVRVHGLVNGQRAKKPLARATVGPDGDGKVEFPVDMRIPPGRFDGVRISAHAVGSETAGNLTLPLAPVPVSPTINATWVGAKADASRLEVHAVANNAASSLTAADGAGARLAVVVKGRSRHRPWRLYRATLRPDADGAFDATFQVPVGPRARTVCIGAAFVKKGAEFPSFPCKGTVEELSANDRTVVQIRRPAEPPDPPAPVDP